MKIDIVIPTYKRLNQLVNCIDSVILSMLISIEHEFKIHVFFSDDAEFELIRSRLHDNDHVVCHLLDKEYRAPVFWNDYLLTMKADALAYINDDVKLDYKALRHAVGVLENEGTDSVVGFFQENAGDDQGICKAAFGLIGSTFADRFPERQVFCPDYYALGLDRELFNFAESVGRFFYCEEAKIFHYHPAFTGEIPDETHHHNRRNIGHDVEVKALRKERGLLWGKNFERVTK